MRNNVRHATVTDPDRLQIIIRQTVFTLRANGISL